MIRIRSLAVLCTFLLGGCSSTVLPDRWGSLDEAFPPQGNWRAQAIPEESQQRATFAASYEDVYRAALTSLSQAQYNVGREDKKGGSLAGTRIVQVPPGPRVGDSFAMPQERRYHVAVSLQERGPKSTEVVVAAKAQGRCSLIPSGAHVLLLGVSVENNNRCKAYAEVHWASGNTSVSQDLNTLMTFIRNNLLAAGVL